MIEGTRSLLLASGLPHDWWAEAMACYCFSRNVVDRVHDDTFTPYEARHNEKFKGLLIPFGAAVEYHPTAKRETAALMKFTGKTRKGIFMGYHVASGGKFVGDYLVKDVEAFETMEYSRYIAVHRVKDVLTPTKIESPVKNGTVSAKAIERRLKEKAQKDTPLLKDENMLE